MSLAAESRVDAWVCLSPGELVDRITILEIKLAHLGDVDRRARVEHDLRNLRQAYDATCRHEIEASEPLRCLVDELRRINRALWESEDEVRRCERLSDFGPRFVVVARSIVRDNDERARIKRGLNDRLGSRLGEDKVFDAERT
jgi:hypothetical protein